MAKKKVVSEETLVRKQVDLRLNGNVNGLTFLNREMSYIDKHTSSPSMGGLIALGGGCGLLAQHYGIDGVIAVLKGDAGGWALVHRAVLYYRWQLRICRAPLRHPEAFASYSEKAFLRKMERVAACLACFARACGLEELEAEALATLCEIPNWPGSVDQKHWTRRIFEPFVMVLLKRIRGESVHKEFATRDLGVYGEVIEAWENPTQLGQALSHICDYHCQQMDGDVFKWYPEFDRPPFDLLPVEILAIRRIRQQLGLAMPEVQHPLLDLPTANLPPPAPEDTQPDEVLRRIQKAYPELLDGE